MSKALRGLVSLRSRKFLRGLPALGWQGRCNSNTNSNNTNNNKNINSNNSNNSNNNNNTSNNNNKKGHGRETSTSESWPAALSVVAGGVALSSALLQSREPLALALTSCDEPVSQAAGSEAAVDDWFSNPALCSDTCGRWSRLWQPDWDGRAPPPADGKGKGEKSKTKPQGKVRHLLLIRHGQYDLEDEEHGLTDLGREQVKRLGERLATEARGLRKDRYGEIKVKYAGIWVSDVTRARQTAEILATILEGVALNPPDPLLAEGYPTVPHPCSKSAKIKPANLWEESARLEAGFRKYVHRAVDHKRLAEKQRRKEEKRRKELGDGFHPGEEGAKAEEDKGAESTSGEPEHTYEVIVCHMNVIRYFTMRALQLPPEAWLRMRGDNTGITEIAIHPDGRVSLHRFADVGHLPVEMVTFH